MVEQELQQLELSGREHRLLALVAHHPTTRIKPEAVQLPYPLVPKVEPLVVALQLRLDEVDVLVGSLSCGRMQLRQLPVGTFQETELEADQIVVDAHPVARVFPVRRLDVLAFKRTGGGLLGVSCHGHNLDGGCC